MWKFVFLFMDLLENWLPAGCGGWLGWLGACLGLGLGVRAGLAGWPWRGGRAVGVAPGPVVRCADCAAVLSRGAAARKLAALCHGQSSAQTAAPSLMWKCACRRTRPTACAPRHRPSRLPHGPPATPVRRRVGVPSSALRKLEQLDWSAVLEDLRVPPGNRLEALTGDRKGQHSIRVNDQWRVCFVWTPEGPRDVEIVDYH